MFDFLQLLGLILENKNVMILIQVDLGGYPLGLMFLEKNCADLRQVETMEILRVTAEMLIDWHFKIEPTHLPNGQLLYSALTAPLRDVRKLSNRDEVTGILPPGFVQTREMAKSGELKIRKLQPSEFQLKYFWLMGGKPT